MPLIKQLAASSRVRAAAAATYVKHATSIRVRLTITLMLFYQLLCYALPLPFIWQRNVSCNSALGLCHSILSDALALVGEHLLALEWLRGRSQLVGW